MEDNKDLIPIVYIHNKQWMFYMAEKFESLPIEEKLSVLDQLEDWVKERKKFHTGNKK
jgi:hypothetical protein